MPSDIITTDLRAMSNIISNLTTALQTLPKFKFDLEQEKELTNLLLQIVQLKRDFGVQPTLWTLKTQTPEEQGVIDAQWEADDAEAQKLDSEWKDLTAVESVRNAELDGLSGQLDDLQLRVKKLRIQAEHVAVDLEAQEEKKRMCMVQ